MDVRAEATKLLREVTTESGGDFYHQSLEKVMAFADSIRRETMEAARLAREPFDKASVELARFSQLGVSGIYPRCSCCDVLGGNHHKYCKAEIVLNLARHLNIVSMPTGEKI